MMYTHWSSDPWRHTHLKMFQSTAYRKIREVKLSSHESRDINTSQSNQSYQTPLFKAMIC